MPIPHSRTECLECCAVIDTTADTPDRLVPCSKCGSIKRPQYHSATSGQPSNDFLDNFVAHKLSLLTKCGAQELPGTNWLNTFILTCVFKVSLPAKTRAYVFNFIRRAEGALSAYSEARVALTEYVNTPRTVLSPYFRALLNFEVCISRAIRATNCSRRSQENGSLNRMMEVNRKDCKFSMLILNIWTV